MISRIRRFPAFVTAGICFLVLLPVVALAGTTGRIKGLLTDKETGEPVIGASVLIVGTSIGAQSDLDGNFVIQRVEPGTHTIKVSSVEYNDVEITDVQVQADITSEQNVELVKKVTELGETITVVGKKDIIDKFQVSSSVSIGQESITACKSGPS